MFLLNDVNDSIEAVNDVSNLTYVGISKDLDYGKTFPILSSGNASTNITYDKCPNVSWDDFSLWPLIAFISVAVIGVFLCLLGYRFLRAAVFIISVVVTSGLVYVICCEVVASTLPPLVVVGMSVLSGFMAGLISILLVSCFGSRVTCIAAGIILATYLLTVLRILFQFPLPMSESVKDAVRYYRDDEMVYEEDNQTTHYFSKNAVDIKNGMDWNKIFPVVVSLVSMAIFGCAMLVASFLRSKATLVLSTSIIGSAMISLSMDFFTDKLMFLARVALDCLVVKVSLVEQFCQVDRCCWVMLVVLMMVPLVTLLSALFQWCCTSSGIQHELDKLGLVSCGSNNGSCTSNRQSVPMLMEPSEKYRHLYRIRRTNGDIISRTHMEAIEVRRSNPSLVLTAARSNSDVVTTTDDDATLVLTQTLDE